MKSWERDFLMKLDNDVYERLGHCVSRKADIVPLSIAYLKYKGEKEIDCEDALVYILELLDSNGRDFELSTEEYDDILSQIKNNLRVCPECGKRVSRADMSYSRDCHGITMRLLCHKCLDRIYSKKGYDGVYYSDTEEQIDADY